LILTHQFQANVNCIKWSPTCNLFAVGCDHGTCLWTFVASNPGTRLNRLDKKLDRTAWMQFLPCPGLRIRGLEWSPCGRYLASWAVGCGTFVVWDVAKGRQGSTPLSAGADIVTLRWSPDGGSLFVGTAGNCFRIWKTFDWTSTAWMKANFSSACWDKRGEVLLLASTASTKIAIINFSPKAQALQNRMSIDLTPTQKVPGGCVHQMEWSPNSKRLVISFRDDGRRNSELIAVFGTTWRILPTFQPLGFIRGPAGQRGVKNMPILMRFRPHCKGGALLAVCWAQGQITLYPMLFDSK